MKTVTIICIVYLAGISCGQTQNEIPEDILDIVKNELPGLEKFNQSSVPSLEETTELVKQKCDKNGGEGAFDKLQAAKDEVQTCITDNFNITQIQEEVEKAKPTGSMDEVFAKYCAKKSIAFNCLKNLTESIKSCMEEEEKENMKLAMNVTDRLVDFVCLKDGDRIAMFIAEGGVECLQSQKDAIGKCANETFSHRVPHDLSLQSLPMFLIGSQECSDFTKFRECVVDELEKCENKTPANIIDALFKFLRSATPCKNQPMSKKMSQTSSTDIISANLFLALTTLNVLLALYF